MREGNQREIDTMIQSPDLRADLCDRYRSGSTIADLSRAHGISYRQVRDTLLDCGAVLRKPGKRGLRPFSKRRKVPVEALPLIRGSSEADTVLAARYKVSTQRIGQLRRAA
jgi:hypothetical protein